MATIFVYALLLKPAYEDVNKLRGDLSAKSALLESQKKVVGKVKTLLEQYQGLSQPQQALLLSLPNKEEYPALINQMKGLVGDAGGLLLESIRFRKLPVQKSADVSEIKLPLLGTLQVSLSVKGPYQVFKNFMQLIERNVRVMDFVSIGINPVKEGDENYAYTAVVNTYYQTFE